MSNKPILVLDFDGVCHSYTSGWKGADVIPDPPVDGLFEFIESTSEYFDVCVFGSRSNQSAGVFAMKEWFEKHRPGICEFIRFPNDKPAAFMSIDDRGFQFNGVWPSIDELKAFKPWYLREAPKTEDRRPCIYPIGNTSCGYTEYAQIHEGSPSEIVPPRGRHKYKPE